MSDRVDPSIITFLMVGCQRCGTTWVDAAIRSHPEVFLPAQKQTYFFDRHWERGSAWYLDNFRDARPEQRAVGEVATGYCLLEAIPRMAGMLPHARLLMCMRHPVERAYSYYQSRRSEMGWTSFEQALAESEDLQERGRYIEQIERILHHYDRDRLLLLFYEDLAKDDRAFLDRILDFIGVDRAWQSPLLGQRKNAAMFPRVRRVLHSIGLKRVLVEASRSPVGDVVRKVQKRFGQRGYAEMNPVTRQELSQYFRPFNERLAAFTGRDLDQWNR